jgi:hypothetical protein
VLQHGHGTQKLLPASPGPSSAQATPGQNKQQQDTAIIQSIKNAKATGRLHRCRRQHIQQAVSKACWTTTRCPSGPAVHRVVSAVSLSPHTYPSHIVSGRHQARDYHPVTRNAAAWRSPGCQPALVRWQTSKPWQHDCNLVVQLFCCSAAAQEPGGVGPLANGLAVTCQLRPCHQNPPA